MAPERFRRRGDVDDDGEGVYVGMDRVDANAVKLDRILTDQGDMRVAMTSLAGDVKAMLQRIERHDGDHAQRDVERSFTGQDIERRLRTLERRSYGIPSLAALLGVGALGVSLWQAFGR